MQVKHERSADTLALGARAVVPSRVSVRDRGKDGAVGKLGKFLNRGALDFLPTPLAKSAGYMAEHTAAGNQVAIAT
jgi:hypothetical protein